MARKIKYIHTEFDDGEVETIILKPEEAQLEQALERVLNKLRTQISQELNQDKYSPLLKVACLLAENATWKKKSGTKLRQVRLVEPPSWLTSTVIRYLAHSKKRQGREESASETTDAIKTYLNYAFIQRLKEKNKTRRLDVFEFLAKQHVDKKPVGGIALTDDGLKKQYLRAKRLQLEPIGEDDFLVFGIDTERLEKAFKIAIFS